GKLVMIWGTGKSMCEFFYVDDLAEVCLFLMRYYADVLYLNVGMGVDQMICEFVEMMRDVVWPQVWLVFDATKPDGMPRKLLDVSWIYALGWKHRIGLREKL